MSIPRPLWAPGTYADAVSEAAAGLPEHHYLEFKQGYPAGSSYNEKMAGDLASLANDGGLLVVGVAENKTTATSTGVTPIQLKGFIERVEQVARTLDPPLNVESWTLANPANDTEGVVFIRVPASDLAPHQANQRYYGRNERTSFKLSDAEVDTLMRRRAARGDRVRGVLDHPPGYDWVRNSEIGRFVAVVEPIGNRRPDLLASVLAPAGYPGWLDEVFGRVEAARTALLASDPDLAEYVWQAWSPFTDTIGWSHCRMSAGLRAGGPPAVARRSPQLTPDSGGRVAWFGVDESAMTAVALDQLVAPEPNVAPAVTTFDWPTMVAATAWLVLATREICESVGLSSPLAVGVRADGLSAALPVVLGSGTWDWMRARTNRAASTGDRFVGEGHVPAGLKGQALRACLHGAFGPLLRGTGLGDLLRPS